MYYIENIMGTEHMDLVSFMLQQEITSLKGVNPCEVPTAWKKNIGSWVDNEISKAEDTDLGPKNKASFMASVLEQK